MTAISTDEAVVRYGVRHTRRYGTGVEPSPTGPYVRFEDYATLRARCEALEADAARWRLFREHGEKLRAPWTLIELGLDPDELDAAIDAARTTTEEGK